MSILVCTLVETAIPTVQESHKKATEKNTEQLKRIVLHFLSFENRFKSLIENYIRYTTSRGWRRIWQKEEEEATAVKE